MLAGLTALLFVFGCKKPDESCYQEKNTAAFVLDYPDTVAVGEVFVLNVNYVVENSCGDFGRFEAEKYDNTLEVKLKTEYKGCSCDDEFQQKTVAYPIIFEEAGTYQLKFWVSDSEYETYIIVVQ